MAARIDILYRDYANNLASPLTLSSDGLTVTLSSGTTPSGLRYFSGAPHAHASTGKWYYEVVFSGVSSTNIRAGWMAFQGQIGIDPTTWNGSGQLFGTSTANSSQITDFTTGAPVSGPSWTYAASHTLMLAVDIDSAKFWYGIDGTWFGSGDPGAGSGQQWTLGATYQPMLCVRPFFELSTSGTTATATLVFNFGTTTYTVPSGFSVIDSMETRQSGEVVFDVPRLDSYSIPSSKDIFLPSLARTPETSAFGQLRTGSQPALLRSAYSDTQYGGLGKVYGTISKKLGGSTYPAYSRARLLRSVDLMVMGEVWTDATTGAYEFDYVPLGVECMVLSVDHTGTYTAVVKDREYAVAM